MPATIPGRVSTQVRLDKVAYQKMKVIAKMENRNTNSQLEYFMKQGVAKYEAEHGPIQLSEESEE